MKQNFLHKYIIYFSVVEPKPPYFAGAVIFRAASAPGLAKEYLGGWGELYTLIKLNV